MILPSCTGPMLAMRSSVAWILPVATTDPSIFVGCTISTSMPEFCPFSDAESLVAVATVTLVVSVPDREQPRARAETSSVRVRKSRKVVFMNIRVPCCLEQRSSGRQLEIEERRLIVENRLVKAGQCISPGAYRVEQLER